MNRLPDGNAVVTYTYLQASLLTKLLTHEDPGHPQVTYVRWAEGKHEAEWAPKFRYA